jgi:hypothetical protein
MKVHVLAAANSYCVGMPTHGVLPAATSLTSTTVHSSDLTMVSGPLDWKGLTASGQLSCNETLIFDSEAAFKAASLKEKLAGAYVRLCPTLAQSEDMQGMMETPPAQLLAWTTSRTWGHAKPAARW